MKLFLVALVSVFSISAFAKISTVNCGTYGPDEHSLAVILDDEAPGGVLLVGYSVMGNFFEFKVRGCRSIQILRGKVLCDSLAVGLASTPQLEVEDPGYEGLRAFVKLDPKLFEITGSCRPQDKKPLTITFGSQE